MVLIIFLKDDLDSDIENLTKNYNSNIKDKDLEIDDLKRKIEDMSNEFARMLRVFIYQIIK